MRGKLDIQSWKNCCVLFFFLFAIGVSVDSFGQNEQDKKEKYARIHAVFIYNFTRYFEWPKSFSPNEFKIGVLAEGDTTLIKELKHLATTKKVGDRKMVIIEFKSTKEIVPTEILYIDSKLHPEADLLKLMVKNSLLVTENNPDFNKSMISFVVVDGKMKIALNKENVALSDLLMSPDFEKLTITSAAEWKNTFDKFEHMLNLSSKNEMQVTRKDLENIVKTQKEQLAEIQKQKTELEVKINYIKQQEDLIASQQRRANALNTEITEKSKILDLTKIEIETRNQALKNQKIVLRNKEKEISEKSLVLKNQQNEITNQKGVLNKQRNIIILFVFFLATIILLLFFVGKSLRKNKQQKAIIEEKQLETEKQKRLVEQKNHEIIDSIKYAQRIQKALITSERYIQKNIGKYNS